jgi:hypothetical protein
MTCNVCQFQTCVVHKRPWHMGLTCAEFDAQDSEIERKELESASMKLVANTAKQCPKCHQGVTKEAGCDQLSCKFPPSPALDALLELADRDDRRLRPLVVLPLPTAVGRDHPHRRNGACSHLQELPASEKYG